MGSNAASSVELLARAGYAARGTVYLLIGGLASWAGLRGTGGAPDSEQALVRMVGAPLGTVALAFVAAGLIGYAVWRTVQAVLDADGHGSDAKGRVVRGGLLVSAVTHGLLAAFAIRLLLGTSGGGGSSTEDWTAWLMGRTAGIWLVGFVGVAVLGAGVAQAHKGWTEGFRRHMVLPAHSWLVPVCRFGLLARGAVFGIVGVLIVLAAWRAEPARAGGLGAALATLYGQPYGRYLFVLVSLGLLAFGVYSVLESVYRRIHTPKRLKRAVSPFSA